MYGSNQLTLSRMLPGLLCLLLLSGFTAAYPVDPLVPKDSEAGFCPVSGKQHGNPTAAMTDCDCLGQDNAAAAAVGDPQFQDHAIQSGYGVIENYTRGYDGLASNVSVLVQKAGCDDYKNPRSCASALLWVEFNRPLGPEICKVPDGGRKVSKDECVDMANSARASW